jgi:membrane protein YdbS with pleckstrin-like domain
MMEEEQFENPKVELANLPLIEKEEFSKLHSEYLGLRIVARIMFFAILAAAGAILYSSTELEIYQIYVPLVSIAMINLSVEWLGFKNKGFLLRERDITYRTGLIFRRMTTVPLVRIQHSEVTQGPLQRLFDLSTVKIYTAGGSTSDLSIPGLSPEEAHKIRDFINHTVHEQTVA